MKKVLSEIANLESKLSSGKKAKYNPDGAWYYYGFGGGGLEHPIYHEEGRYIDVHKYINTPSTTKGLVEISQFEQAIKKLLSNINSASSKNANYVNLGWRVDKEILDALLNPVFLDTNDQFKDYERWEKKWKEENNTTSNPTKEQIIKNYK